MTVTEYDAERAKIDELYPSTRSIQEIALDEAISILIDRFGYEAVSNEVDDRYLEHNP
jgi:hypothetical protein